MNRRVVSIRSLVVLAAVAALAASSEAGSPPLPSPSVWIGAGGAIGEPATVQVQYPGQYCPYVLVYSPSANPTNSWPPIVPPYGLLAAGLLDAQGAAAIPVPVPGNTGLVGAKVHFVAAVDDPSSFGRSYSPVCLWTVAPPHPRRFVPVAGAKPIPYNPGNGHARATLQSGQVLFAGGMAGGCVPMARSDAYVYDPTRLASARVGDLVTPRTGHVARTLGDGTVLIVGGDWMGATPTAELYSPTAQTFQSLGPVPFTLSGATATVLRAPGTGHEYVLIAGGLGSSGPSSQAMLYDAWNRTFVALPAMKRARYQAAAVAFSAAGAVLITGGQDAQYSDQDHAELFLLATRQFYDWGRMVRPRAGHAMTALDATHALVLGGGSTPDMCREIEVFSGLGRTAQLLPPPLRLHLPRSHFEVATQPDGSVVVAGSLYAIHPNPGRTPEWLTAAGSTLLRPMAEPSEYVVLHPLLGGGVLALGLSRVHHLQ
ncbi:MAG: hypothetical protein JXQ29_11300 [Planctomycetes bacterium]|nr:hypothetical protein [Planctomycetota bacterium]